MLGKLPCYSYNGDLHGNMCQCQGDLPLVSFDIAPVMLTLFSRGSADKEIRRKKA